jgi:hypothetical protein
LVIRQVTVDTTLVQKNFVDWVGISGGFIKITIQGIDLIENPSEFNNKFPLQVNAPTFHITDSQVGTISGRDTNINVNLLDLLKEAEKAISNADLKQKEKQGVLDKIKGIISNPVLSSTASSIVVELGKKCLGL